MGSPSPEKQRRRLISAIVGVPAGMVVGRVLLAFAAALTSTHPGSTEACVAVYIGASGGAIFSMMNLVARSEEHS